MFVDSPVLKGDKSFKSRKMAEPKKSKISEKEVVKQTRKKAPKKK